MSRRSLLMLVLVCAASSGVRAAPPVNDYYDPSKSTDGQAWPPFYKQHELDPKHAHMYDMGWCRWKPYKYDPKDLVDVNKLPQVTFPGRIEAVHKSVLGVTDDKDKTKFVAIHDSQNVTRVLVEGTALPAGLAKGMYVKFVGTVGADQRATEPVDRLEVFTPSSEVGLPTLELHKQMVVWGQILTIHDNKLVLSGVPGKSKPVTLTLAQDADIKVRSADYTLAQPGDAVTVKGRMYHPDEHPDVDQVFALEVRVTLTNPLGKKPEFTVAAK